MRSPNKGRPPVAPAYRVLTTSGTTGLRGIFALTHDEAEVWVAATLRTGVRAGIRPDARAVGIGSPSRVHLTRQLFAAVRGAPAGPDVSTATPLSELVAVLNAYQPQVLLGYPSVAGVLADEQLAGRPAHPPHRRRLRRRAAHPGPAAPHPRGLGLRAREGGGRRRQRRASRDARFQGPAHNLVNHAQPLIRYELSDAATLSAGANPAGRPYRCLTSVDGRSADILRLPARGGGRTAVHPSALGAAVGHLPQLRQYQFVLDERGLHARVVLAPDAPSGTAEDLRAALVRALEATGAIAPAVDVEEAAALQREPSGKFRLVTVPMTPDMLLRATVLGLFGAVSVSIWTLRVALTAEGRRTAAALVAGMERGGVHAGVRQRLTAAGGRGRRPAC